MRTSKWFASILGIALVAFGTSALAAISYSWSFDTGCSNSSSPGGTCTKTSSGVTVTAQAWSTTANNGGTNNAMQTAYLRSYGSSGLGATNQDWESASGCASGKDCNEADGTAPEHAVDNNERRDSILFTFSEAIKLTQVTIGWPPSSNDTNDSDITVLAYLPVSGAPDSPALNGQTEAQMTAAGWKLASHNSDVANDSDNTADVNNATYNHNYVSRYWLIGAYNSAFESAGWSTGNDYVKFLALAGTQTTQVPEPSTLLLFGIAAMAGLWRRRQYAHR